MKFKRFSVMLLAMGAVATGAVCSSVEASGQIAAGWSGENGLVSTIGNAVASASQSGEAISTREFTLPLWPDGKPNDSGLTEDGDTSNPGWVTLIAEPELYVYRPEKPNGTAILMCPGGGYYGLAMLHEGKDLKEWMNSMGITYVILKYRMPNGHHEVPLSDAEQAMRIIRSNAKAWGVNPEKVGVMGASAGGHLASTLSTHYSSAETRPDFQILFYPVITMEKGVTHQGSRDLLIGKNPSKELETLYSNETQVTAETPQAFIMVSSDDDAVPVENTYRYVSSMAGKKVPVSLHVYPTGGHGWGFRDNFPYKQQWMQELSKWLRERIFQ